MKRRGLFWFRSDLRVNDMPALHAMFETVDEAVFLFVIDERWLEKGPFDFYRMGRHRLRFMWESVLELAEQLAEKGAELNVAIGKPAETVLEMARACGCDAVFGHKEHTHEELEEERKVQENMEVHWFESATLIHPMDLPFEILELPEVFSRFRNRVEKKGLNVRPALEAPKRFPPGPSIKMPTLQEVGARLERHMMNLQDEGNELTRRDAMSFQGGMRAGQERLEAYTFRSGMLSRYKQTRNGMLGWDYSSKFSPWLAWGCLSPREIYWKVQQYESQRESNESTYWLVFELLWRDYFRFIAMKHGCKIWHKHGIKGIPLTVPKHRSLDFQSWAMGTTVSDFVNANMRELSATGFMSNRGRQNVASFAVHDLRLDWRAAAAWFEHHLIDFDPCSNTGNWLYVSGIGNDPRPQRKFDVEWQANAYDPDRAFRRFWNE